MAHELDGMALPGTAHILGEGASTRYAAYAFDEVRNRERVDRVP